jgi:hypothetical protein
MKLVNQLKKNLVNITGWSTSKKIVVIESDDWGSVSMPSKSVYDELLSKGVQVDKSFFTQYDSLESEEDLNELFHVLTSFKDYKGNHPCITACAVVANPDFEKIRNSGLKEYFYEPITETYKRYPNHTRSFEIWKKGMKSHLLWPQFHGREHLNPQEWLKCINSDDKAEKLAFKKNAILALGRSRGSDRKMGYLSAFDYQSFDELKNFENVLKEGLDLFEELFGFRSTSFVAPTSVRSDKMDGYLDQLGIKYHQMGQQTMPYAEKYKIKNRMWGAKNEYNQLYWRRNSKFEPSGNPSYDWVGDVMEQIKVAFRWGKPAVISSHRVNFIGGIVKENRENTLRLLTDLLSRILKRYPDVEFMSSDMLGKEISNSK